MKNPLDNLAEICEDILKEEGILVVSFNHYEASSLYDNFSSIVAGNRSSKTIANDAQMLKYLSDKRNHELEPYFVTYDSVFHKMRKSVLTTERRPQLWHLYYPSKLVAHLNMLNFKIDAKNFTNGFVSILTKSTFVEQTNNLADIMGCLLYTSPSPRDS